MAELWNVLHDEHYSLGLSADKASVSILMTFSVGEKSGKLYFRRKKALLAPR